MVFSNDARGWILTCLSGVACTIGASIIAVDFIIRLFPGRKNFKIQDSNGFLSCSLSLSAGVMLFSSLYNMLPSSKSSLQNAGLSPRAATWILVACFLAGVFGIQVLSRVIHHFMPSHIVDCDHTHEEGLDGPNSTDHLTRCIKQQSHHHCQRSPEIKQKHDLHDVFEDTPLLSRSDSCPNSWTLLRVGSESASASPHELAASARPSLQTRMVMSMSRLVSQPKTSCDVDGPCLGYSNPCGQDCFKNITSRGGSRVPFLGPFRRMQMRHYPGSIRTTTHNDMEAAADHLRSTLSVKRQVVDSRTLPTLSTTALYAADPWRPRLGQKSGSSSTASLQDDRYSTYPSSCPSHPNAEAQASDPQSHPHHHHVPTNAFLSIGFQSSIAIAIHKLPEGFITYATNHANPKLGFSIFLALFIHNITEGFALALPLFLALNSRWKALCLATLLGGLSQPAGAGVAAIWLKLAERGRGEYAPGEGIYGGMFAVTAGIMASVGLSLLQEAFELTHTKNLCMAFAFVGMGVLGISSALTA